jgi:DNA-binding response OmpR family regulator/ligand-binding sensor domain-containing protein/nitrogen-specific signal transduction histidine kinase
MHSIPNKATLGFIHRSLIYLSIGVLFSFSLNASQYKFNHLTVKNGLKNSRVVSILQDDYGYMWFGTHNGVEKFSGGKIEHYDLSSDSTFQTRDNIVNCLELSVDYDVLCGTKNGNIFYYSRTLNQFKPIPIKEESNRVSGIYSLQSEKNKGIWIGAANGLLFYDKKKESVKKLNEWRVYDISTYNDTHLWISHKKGLSLLNKNTYKVEDIDVSEIIEKGYQFNNILSTYSITQDELIISTRNSDIFHIKFTNGKIHLLNHKNFSYNNKVYAIQDIKQSPEGNFIFAVDGLGILETNKKLQTKNIYLSDDNDLTTLSSNGIYKLYYSKDNILWVATYGGGVCYYDPNKKPFTQIQHTPYKSNSLINNTVNAILEDDIGRIWYGTKKGISIYNPFSQQWTSIKYTEAKSPYPLHITDLIADNAGNAWAATYGNGLIKIDKNTLQKTIFSKNKSGYYHTTSDHLYNIEIDNMNRIWTGGIWGITTIIDPIKKTSTHLNLSNIRSFLNYGMDMYVGTLFGLYIVNTETLEIKKAPFDILNKSRIITIKKHLENNILYFGTYFKGLVAWNLDDQSFELTTTDNGLLSNSISAIEWESPEKMWISSSEGLSAYSIKDKTINNYLPVDGITSTEFSENAALKLLSGELIFGGINGATLFYPNQITKSTQITKPIFTGIKLHGKKLSISEDGPLTQNIDLQKSIHLMHNENALNITFSAIGYSSPERIKYKWIMEGFDKKWNGPSQIKEAIYSKLPPGKYTFKVKCTNDDEVWQKDIKSFVIHISKPIWKKPIAYIIYMIIMAGIIFLIIHYSQVIIQEKNHEEKQQFFVSIAHDLRTPLSLINLPVEKMLQNKNNTQLDITNLKVVKRNIDRLTNMVNQLLDFQKADFHKMKLQIEEHPFLQFIKERIEIFTPLTKEKNIQINLSLPYKEVYLWYDKGKMEKVMYNLLSNAIKYNSEGGIIKVEVHAINNKCYVTVSDTGEGIPKNQQKNIFQRYYRATNAINSQEVGSGVGLVLTKQIIELHHGKISFKSEFGKGTSFTFSLPVDKNVYSEENFKQYETEDQQLKPTEATKKALEDEITFTGGEIKMLLIEDNPELLESLTQEFSNEFNVIKATDGLDGFKMAKKHIPDIIISDVMMPNMNGHELCLKVKRDLSICHIPIILLSALDSADYKREGIEHGADAYIEKPFDLKFLRAQVNNLLKNRNLLKNKFLIPFNKVEEYSPTNKDQEFLERIQSHIISNMEDTSMSVETLAKNMGMSRPVLYRKIKALTDLSPQQFVINLKLKEAARIMQKENKNISETAFMVGFTDPKYFSQTFKKHFGITPSQYLKKGGGGE